MRMRIAPLFASGVLLFTLMLGWGAPAVLAAGAPSAADGMITGSVVNATRNNGPVTDQAVTLQETTPQGKTQDVKTATSDGAGQFTFAGLDASGATAYAVYTHFQGGTFASDVIRFTQGAAQQVTLSVYDTTTSDHALSVSVATILFSEPNTAKGLVSVHEFLVFNNSGNEAYVTSEGPANGKPMNLLRFALPPGATNLALGAGFAGATVAQVNTGFAATGTLPPGKSEFAFAFDAPYSGTDYVFQYKVEYPTDQIVALVPLNMLTDGRDFEKQPPVDAMGQKYQLLTRNNVAPDTQLSARLWDLPVPGEQLYLDFRQLVALVGALAVLLAGLIMAYLKRGDLMGLVARGASARPAVAHAGASGSDVDREEERTRLLQMLLDLEARHSAGKLDEETYRRQRDATRATLRNVLASQHASAMADRPNGEAVDSAASADSGATTAERPAATGGSR